MKDLNLIDKYFNNSLTPKEKLLFNELLQNDKDFKKEFLFHKDLKKAISLDQQNEMKIKLQGFEQNIQKKSKIIRLPKKWLIAASIIILIGLGFFFIKSSFYPSPEKLYAQNFKPYRNIIQPIVRGESSNTIEYRAFLAYENNNYHKAINLFNSINNPDATYISFYKAMCFLSLDKPSEAINLLLPITLTSGLKGNDKKLGEKADWYLALAYLKTNEKEKAISIFSVISNHPTRTCKKEESKILLEYLN